MREQEKIVISHYLAAVFVLFVVLNASCNQVNKTPGQQVKAT
ncbi:MAG: hypothetical protein QM763_10115 [Agriterribacter sp.]